MLASGVSLQAEQEPRDNPRLPLLDTLLENIGCWPVELVAAGCLLKPVYAEIFPVRKCAVDGAGFDSAERGKETQTEVNPWSETRG